jgi:hypothetical protein
MLGSHGVSQAASLQGVADDEVWQVPSPGSMTGSAISRTSPEPQKPLARP